MDATPPTPPVFRFGLFQLDTRTGELLRDGRRVRLQEQPLRVLALLLERPGQLVTREELRQALWSGDTFVDFDDSLNAAITRLRASLGESSDQPTFIETIPRRGYRFIAPVTSEAEAVAPIPEAPVTAEPPPTPRRGLPLAAIGLLVALAAGVMVIARQWSTPPGTGADAQPVRSLVVLPLTNLSRDPEQEYFADGMTDELITRLASLEGVRVISRTSAMRFKDTGKLLPQIAAELEVDAVVVGSVLRSGDRVRITAQLVHGATDRHLWAESFEREERDVLLLQDEVAAEIARKISATLGPRVATTRASRRIDPEAHRAFLRGRYRWHSRRPAELLQAVGDFERAIALDPGYALAYAGLADVHLVLPLINRTPQQNPYRRARDAAEKALALDPSLAEAHNSHAYVKMYLDWGFTGAERGFRKAIELNPNYATAHQWYAELLSFQGRHEEALREIRIALELDPLSAVIHHQAGQTLQQARRYDEAIEEYENAITLDPQFTAHSANGMSWAYARRGMLEPAARALDRSFAASPPPAHLVAGLKRAAESGDPRAFLQKRLETAPSHLRTPCYHAVYNLALGRDDDALEHLDQAVDQRLECVLSVNVNPDWDRLRSDARFAALMRRIGLAPVAASLASAQVR